MTVDEALAEVEVEVRDRGEDAVVWTHGEETLMLAAEVRRLRELERVDVGLLDDEQLTEFQEQNRLLREMGDECVSVAEFLSCRLEDALVELSDVTHATETGGVVVYRISGDAMLREPVEELLTEFEARGEKLARVEAEVAFAKRARDRYSENAEVSIAGILAGVVERLEKALQDTDS